MNSNLPSSWWVSIERFQTEKRVGGVPANQNSDNWNQKMSGIFKILNHKTRQRRARFEILLQNSKLSVWKHADGAPVTDFYQFSVFSRHFSS